MITVVLFFSVIAGAALGYVFGLTYPEEKDRDRVAVACAIAFGAIAPLIAISISGSP